MLISCLKKYKAASPLLFYAVTVLHDGVGMCAAATEGGAGGPDSCLTITGNKDDLRDGFSRFCDRILLVFFCLWLCYNTYQLWNITGKENMWISVTMVCGVLVNLQWYLDVLGSFGKCSGKEADPEKFGWQRMGKIEQIFFLVLFPFTFCTGVFSLTKLTSLSDYWALFCNDALVLLGSFVCHILLCGLNPISCAFWCNCFVFYGIARCWGFIKVPSSWDKTWSILCYSRKESPIFRSSLLLRNLLFCSAPYLGLSLLHFGRTCDDSCSMPPLYRTFVPQNRRRAMTLPKFGHVYLNIDCSGFHYHTGVEAFGIECCLVQGGEIVFDTREAWTSDYSRTELDKKLDRDDLGDSYTIAVKLCKCVKKQSCDGPEGKISQAVRSLSNKVQEGFCPDEDLQYVVLRFERKDKLEEPDKPEKRDLSEVECQWCVKYKWMPSGHQCGPIAKIALDSGTNTVALDGAYDDADMKSIIAGFAKDFGNTFDNDWTGNPTNPTTKKKMSIRVLNQYEQDKNSSGQRYRWVWGDGAYAKGLDPRKALMSENCPEFDGQVPVWQNRLEQTYRIDLGAIEGLTLEKFMREAIATNELNGSRYSLCQYNCTNYANDFIERLYREETECSAGAPGYCYTWSRCVANILGLGSKLHGKVPLFLCCQTGFYLWTLGPGLVVLILHMVASKFF